MQAPTLVAIAGLVASFDEVAVRAGTEATAQRGGLATTAVDGARVPDSAYGARADVYLAGGRDDAAPAGDYYFAVTDRSGYVLSSDDVSCRKIRISGDGAIVEPDGASGCAHARGAERDRAGAITVQLMPFDNASDPDHVYTAWIIPVADYDGTVVHPGARYAAFKIIETPPAVCGNGIVEAGEPCDDGNTTDGDGCSSTCTTETAPVCSTSLVPGEQCDEGNTAIEVLPPSCADGEVGEAEDCNDADPGRGEDCASTCRLAGSATRSR